MGKQTKRRMAALGVVVFLLAVMAFVDWRRVKAFELPVFARPTQTADDGDSGTYQGAGYRFEIEGNFMPEDELPGVTRYEYYIFGRLVTEGLRD